MIKTVIGSSPHTRDKLILICNGFCWFRIIPAYAGQMRFNKKVSFSIKDHPRIRGTNLSQIQLQKTIKGSSPHTRDKCLSRLLLFH